MKNKMQPRHRLKAWVLVGTYALFWLSWTSHYFFSPEHHHQVRVYHNTPNEQQFHGEEYGQKECSVCHLAPTLAELPPSPTPLLAATAPVPARSNHPETTLLQVASTTLFQPRAPPVCQV